MKPLGYMRLIYWEQDDGRFSWKVGAGGCTHETGVSRFFAVAVLRSLISAARLALCDGK